LLPKNDPIHPLTGQRIVVVNGPFKGLYGNVKEVGATAVTVVLGALLSGVSSPIQTLKLSDFKPL
jgi:transcription antitermination factor NusG